MGAYPRARNEGIVAEEVGDELVVYVEATQTAHALSGEAASAWRQCDGETSAEEIARRVGLGKAQVAQALEELSDVELIEEPEGISRREAYKRAAKLGAGAIAAPLVYSVAIGPATAAASGGCTGSGCSGPTSVTLGNGTCAKPCTGFPAECTSSTGCFGHLGGGNFCGGAPVPPVSGSFCFSDTDCPAGSFCDVGEVCISATC